MSVPPTGLHHLSDADYFSIDLPSSSQTKTLLSGTNAHLAFDRATPRADTDAFALGAYVHALLLAPESIESGFVKAGTIDKRTTAGKAEYAALVSRAERLNARIITAELVWQAEEMAASVRANPSARALLDALTEREVTVIGEIAEQPAKGKVDGIIRLPNFNACAIVDLKTTESASAFDFASSAAKFGYYHQAAFYRRLVEQTVAVVDDVIVIAVEKKAPYLCAVYRIPVVAIETANAKIDGLVKRWWDVHDGDVTGYPTDITPLTPPRWWMSAANDS